MSIQLNKKNYNFSTANLYRKDQNFTAKFYLTGVNIRQNPELVQTIAFTQLKKVSPKGLKQTTLETDKKEITNCAKRRSYQLKKFGNYDYFLTGSNGAMTVDLLITEQENEIYAIRGIIGTAFNGETNFTYVAFETSDLAFNGYDERENRKFTCKLFEYSAKAIETCVIKYLKTFEDLTKGDRVSRITNAIDHCNENEQHEIDVLRMNKTAVNNYKETKKLKEKQKFYHTQVQSLSHTIENVEFLNGSAIDFELSLVE